MDDDDDDDLVNVSSFDFHSFVYGMFAAYPTWKDVWQQFRLDLPRTDIHVDGVQIRDVRTMDAKMSHLSPNDMRVLTSLCTQAALAPVFEVLHRAYDREGREWFTDDRSLRMCVRVITAETHNMRVEIDKSFVVVSQHT